MNHIAKQTEHIVLKGETWQLLDLTYGTHLTTSKPFDVYTDREQAISAIKAQYPDYEPPEWDFDPQARIAELKAKLVASDYVALSDYDKDKPEVIAQRAEWRAEIRLLEGGNE